MLVKVCYLQKQSYRFINQVIFNIFKKSQTSKMDQYFLLVEYTKQFEYNLSVHCETDMKHNLDFQLLLALELQ